MKVLGLDLEAQFVGLGNGSQVLGIGFGLVFGFIPLTGSSAVAKRM